MCKDHHPDDDIIFNDLDNFTPDAFVQSDDFQHGFDMARGSARPTAVYEEKCKDCRGSGSFYSYTGRLVGPCFKCKGTGTRKFKTSPEQRQRHRETAAARKQRKLDDFLATELGTYLQSVSDWNEFAASLINNVSKRGGLTDNQQAAAERMMAKAQAKKAAKAQERAAAPEGPDLSEIPTGHYAVPHGGTRLKVYIQQGKNKWDGWTFVKDGAVYGSSKRYGTQRPGENYKGEIIDQLTAILADPFEASCEYGRLTSTCGACGRPLEDEESVARGIGPVCAKKF